MSSKKWIIKWITIVDFKSKTVETDLELSKEQRGAITNVIIDWEDEEKISFRDKIKEPGKKVAKMLQVKRHTSPIGPPIEDDLREIIKDLKKEVLKLTQKVEFLELENAQLRERVQLLEAQNAQLKAENAQLKIRLNKYETQFGIIN
ncbi:hypothetical protein [Williamsoniiplasma lucivorax]|uniref:Uncharacterized protein n=1 Tax=Williamsoniiplasma lucivorax TaxID=209274 RepID=A0A2S5RFB2_9MOLU|nr:hypothetical protein [Williamsoniiplasma lucivorax]PPE06003.1 hypothetical protein ELUCI_v1c02940 [Williamsoniiplasma lucivorax]